MSPVNAFTFTTALLVTLWGLASMTMEPVLICMGGSKWTAAPDRIATMLRVGLRMIWRNISLALSLVMAADAFGAESDGVPTPKEPAKSTSRLKMESGERKLVVRAQLPGQGDWVELATYVMETNFRPYLHPVRDAQGGWCSRRIVPRLF